ncbi:Membrane-associated phospholipid phosphatase [Bifidobacterium saguini DSM 23967]|uniref:Phosphatase PAP2 family protein n=3 Tax=Bifidobacterium TaxID=1678 RepID=A0A2N5IU60_9BIFI|nr:MULTISPECIES: phosphatase PAP2 family protein [Bifidobacterium]KFI93036.1 Membrane-associated phospholipid phosphatase [Bifidobacterium saguini DSM 23967]PLS25500.1 phosphoesterase [Bifidobacterium imperatoris]QSY57074.1 phosphatase PAP2 family protein [Bifidobacterium imperatoris]QTB91330.1 phosphatase PAP2 family protein [Bifidobacterium saguini]
MKTFRNLSSVFAIAVCLPLALAAAPVTAQADQLPNPDWVALLSDYEKNYWQAPVDAEHGGKVLDAKTMKLDEDLAVEINHLGAENADKNGLTAQRKRALIDSDLYGEETLPDALGPVLGRYMREGFKQGKLNQISDLFKFNVASTFQSKRAAMHPRPYLDRSQSTLGGTNDLAGLPSTLDIKESPSWLEHIPGYSTLQKNSSYPSGHTTGAYSWGIALAGILPELAPQIMARTSEAGNNRIVLGVHYPLDIMGGRIGASAQNGQYWHNEFASSIVPAARQLRDYLTERCKADHHGDTLTECISNVKANSTAGYTNDFLDPVATEPVKDQASAVRVYTARMTYTFPQVKAQAGAEFKAPRGAADVLRLAYPQLHVDQRNAILKATAIDSGYPLWESSEGWQRINWAKALCARVTLNTNGDVVKVETADQVALSGPSVISAQYADKGNHPASDVAAGQNSTEAAGPDLAVLHAAQQPALTAVIVGTVAALLVGFLLRVRRKR